MNLLHLWVLLRKRTREANRDFRDPSAITGVLTVIAFASVTALLLVVVGGVGAFAARAELPNASENAQTYLVFAYIAAGLLLVPLATMGGAAARLIVARRDERLANLRLLGATTSQITGLSALDAASQSIAGALLGAVAYFGLIPLVGLVPFEGHGFGFAELWVGAPLLVGVVAAVVVLGIASAVLGLRRVVVSPLGVTKRESTPGLGAIRLAVLAVALIAMVVATSTPAASIAFIAIVLVIGLATLNVVGPFFVGVVGRLYVSGARSAPDLLAARRIIDDPKTAWRSVGGVALATFIAGLASVMALFSEASNPEEQLFMTDVSTGGYLTLAIAGVLAAISTGVTQAGRVISQREQYRNLHLAGAEVEVLEKARMRETVVPMVAAVGLALGASALFMLPVLGAGFFSSIPVLLRFVASVVFAVGLVLLGAGASRGLARAAAAL